MTDPSGSAKTLALPAGFDAPRLLRYDDVTAHAITRDDLGADVRGINASLDLIRETRGGTWPTGPVTEEEGLRRPGPARDRSFTLTAELENPSGNAEGILVTVGGETGGYALVVQDAKPTFHYNWLGRERYAITSTQPLPDGPCTIRFDFAYDDGGGAGKGGTGTLSVNDKQVGEGRIDKTVPVVFSTDDTFDVGADWGTPVSPTYQPPFEFTGTLNQVTIEAR